MRTHTLFAMAVFVAILSVLAGAALAGDAETDYRALLDAYKAKEYAEVLTAAVTFLDAHPDFRYESAVLYMGGYSASRTWQWEKAEAFYSTLLRKHPDYKMAGNAKDGLVTALSQQRKLELCLGKCRELLEAEPDSKSASRWAYYLADSLYRMWRFDEAKEAFEKTIETYPDSSWAKSATKALDRIDPRWEVDGIGVVKGYDGKFVEDARFKSILEGLEELLEHAFAKLEEDLGIPRLDDAGVVFRFEDTAKPGGGGGGRGNTYTVGVKGKPVEVIVFVTEYMVLCREDFEQRLIHELKHASMRRVMGQSYLSLPKWIKEGLALFAAGQIEARTVTIIGNEFFSGGDPMKLLDGIDDAKRDFDDYMEDGLAMEWLGRRHEGAVRDFCRRLMEGVEYREAFAAASGMDFEAALSAAEEYAHERVREVLGPEAAAYKLIEKDTFEVQKKGLPALESWLEEEGAARWSGWLKMNPGHALEPNARYRLGKSLIYAGRHEEGRALMRKVMDEDLNRTTIGDDAAYWYGKSFEMEGKEEEAKEAFGVLLRDYTWSRKAIEAAKKYQAAGPVTEGSPGSDHDK